MSTRISAILLAAGESTRMGTQKALLPWRGVTLIRHQIQSLLEAGVSEVVVVVGYHAERLRPLIEAFPEAKAVLNLRYRTGKSSSVRAGLKHIDSQADAVLVLAVDQPRSPETLRNIVELHRRLGCPITYPAYKGKGGHPIIFSAELMPELMRVRESREGLREVVQRHRSEVARVEVEDAEILLDLNQPDDYQKAVEAAASPR